MLAIHRNQHIWTFTRLFIVTTIYISQNENKISQFKTMGRRSVIYLCWE